MGAAFLLARGKLGLYNVKLKLCELTLQQGSMKLKELVISHLCIFLANAAFNLLLGQCSFLFCQNPTLSCQYDMMLRQRKICFFPNSLESNKF